MYSGRKLNMNINNSRLRAFSFSTCGFAGSCLWLPERCSELTPTYLEKSHFLNK